MDTTEGVISPGGIGFDINCGMRLVKTNLVLDEVRPHLKKIVDRLAQRIPAGVGSTGFLKLTRGDFRRILVEGAKWCVQNGYGWEEDLELTEESGCMAAADPSVVSEKAVERGIDGLDRERSVPAIITSNTTVKQGHIFSQEAARIFGITRPGQVVVMFHWEQGAG